MRAEIKKIALSATDLNERPKQLILLYCGIATQLLKNVNKLEPLKSWNNLELELQI